jgi:hypothetical protein
MISPLVLKVNNPSHLLNLDVRPSLREKCSCY